MQETKKRPKSKAVGVARNKEMAQKKGLLFERNCGTVKMQQGLLQIVK